MSFNYILNLVWIGLSVINVKGDLSDMADVLQTCQEVISERNYLPAYLGWPYGIRCSWVFHDANVFEEYSSGDDNSSYNCSIFSSDGYLLYQDKNSGHSIIYETEKSEYTIPEVNKNETEFLVALNNTYSQECFFLRFRLNVIPTPNETCEEFFEKNYQKINSRKLNLNQHFNFKCVDDLQKNHIDVDNSEFSFEWRHNCQNFPNNKQDQISFHLNEDHYGFYSCSVTYKGMTRYIWYYAICLKHSTLWTDPSLDCDKTEARVLNGEDVILNCEASFGNGNPSKDELQFQWQKENSNLTQCLPVDAVRPHKNAVCMVDYNEKCFQNPKDTTINIKITLRNINEASYGKYVLYANSKYVHKNHDQQITFFIFPDKKPDEKRKNLIIGVCVGILLFFIIMSLIAFYNLLYVQVYFRRYFGKALPDSKLYGVFLTYHYSEDFDNFAKKEVKDFVPQISKLLDDMGYTVYDQKRDTTAGDTADYIEYMMKNSHRILVFLTPEFIKDDWCLFLLQAGFKEMIDSGTKLIFVLLPGVKELVKQRSSIETEYKYIEMAMKINHVIEWPKNKNNLSKRTLFKLEYALPKLKMLSKPQLFSTSSDGEILSRTNGNYEKQESVSTVFSDLSV